MKSTKSWVDETLKKEDFRLFLLKKDYTILNHQRLEMKFSIYFLLSKIELEDYSEKESQNLCVTPWKML